MDFVSVGQGDAELITSPTGKTVLVDGGPHANAQDLVAFLRGRGVGPIDLVVLTHRHDDHLGGLATVIERRGARMFLDAPAGSAGQPTAHASPRYAALMTALERGHVQVRQAEAGRTIDLGGGARLVLLTPIAPPITGSRSDVNANSVVARLDYGRIRVLLTGDAEAPTERWLLAHPGELHAAVLKVPHHGSRYSSTPAFLRAVAPQVAVIEVGSRNAYGHPGVETLDRLERLGAQVYRTDLDGTITVETDGQTLQVHRERQSRAPAMSVR